MPGFVFVADSHVALRGIRPEVPGIDTLIPLQVSVDYALAHGLPWVHGGDLYDKNLPPSRLTAAVEDIFVPAIQKGLQAYVVQGNHDRDPEFPWACHARGV